MRWLAVALLVAITPGVARADEAASEEVPAGAHECRIHGALSGVEIAVRRARGLDRVRLAAPTRVAITPLRPGVTRVRTLEGRSIDGTTREPLRIVLARAISLREGTLELPRGLPLARVDAAPQGPWVVVEAALGDGVTLRRAALPCDALAVEPGEVPIVARERAAAHGPEWRARSERLWLFARPEGSDALRLEVAPGAPARFVERSRRGGWVQLAARTALGALVSAWARDTDLMR